MRLLNATSPHIQQGRRRHTPALCHGCRRNELRQPSWRRRWPLSMSCCRSSPFAFALHSCSSPRNPERLSCDQGSRASLLVARVAPGCPPRPPLACRHTTSATDSRGAASRRPQLPPPAASAAATGFAADRPSPRCRSGRQASAPRWCAWWHSKRCVLRSAPLAFGAFFSQLPFQRGRTSFIQSFAAHEPTGMGLTAASRPTLPRPAGGVSGPAPAAHPAARRQAPLPAAA